MTRLPELQRTTAPTLVRRKAAGSPWASEVAVRASIAVHAIAILLASAIEPAPTNPDVAWAWIGDSLALVWLALLLVAMLRVRQSRVSTSANFAGTGIAVGMVLACPATGHHALAGWWFAELAAFGVAAAVAFATWRAVRAA